MLDSLLIDDAVDSLTKLKIDLLKNGYPKIKTKTKMVIQMKLGL